MHISRAGGSSAKLVQPNMWGFRGPPPENSLQLCSISLILGAFRHETSVVIIMESAMNRRN